ncbi:RING finger and CHY zinc finger domain-containing protein 1 [Anopheles moucheti]|uniref:RING finger and CHY zinc finger domain-containing protein 1 n=1 Tax=Anopheles moucheti TaxID=186751 RepID=UPI0022F0ABCC|nr:RING finger and CHY zinc finger domain-containing protein 1 [Anopheles moucheti]XP_052896134.1 RING finger and CHY zinc finger domain-containing protein 1 [Anopheles moucheti]XP_052896135.1 RING finger and CHY zinc finger domain-containing protein 1 [Anopheles moucheti]XP_052896136.1 RING finger and CHY zinc finger domain-containing protein 1 [Anopheles moucheti]XP_052896137.1 RING finger and CHY zinc finger domain-containing protein 1 [Anopheles moucheti]XP_052896138.1 RING finger and CHY 
MDEKKPIPTPAGGNATATVSSAAEQDENEKRVGCAHYKRRAKFVTPCCNKFYMCRYCHDENETHFFNRKTVTELICTECDTRQRVQAECEKCGVRFGRYTCLVCNLFDDEDRNQYHCDGCGICRVGGRGRFFHCEVCNMCLPLQLKFDGHRCVENVSRSNCPVCLDDIHTSRIPCHIPDCGHLLHRTCFEELLSSGHYACPTCQTSMMDMNQLWEYLDAEVAATPMPKEYANYYVDILCKDCHKESTVKFHVVGLKCTHCGAYNTCRTKTKSINGCSSNTGSSSTSGGSSAASSTAPTNTSETTSWIRMVPLSMVESDDSAIDDIAIDDSEDERLVDRLETYLHHVSHGDDDGASTSAASSSSSSNSSSSAPSSSTMVSTAASVGAGQQQHRGVRLTNGTSSRSDASSSSSSGASCPNGGQAGSSNNSNRSSSTNSTNINGTLAVVRRTNGRTDVAGSSSSSAAHDDDRSSFDDSKSNDNGGAAPI